MPRLRQITCQIEWPESGLKFEEYGTVYGDGVVETFIAVPNKPQPFSIRLASKGYIAEGLAVLIYMDGEYQCNRNRLHLKPSKKGQARDQTEVDFRLRQKEKTIGGGTFIGRDWRFDCHNIVPNGQFPEDFDPTHFDQLGVIEVIVLRCRAKAGDDSSSDSLTHESILSEIDKFGQALEDRAAPDGGSRNHHAAIVDAPEEAVGLAGLTGGDGVADQPDQFGLDGEAPPGYWTYHPQPPPTNNYTLEDRPERRVHFEYGSPRVPYYPSRTPSQQRSAPHRGGYQGGIAGNSPSSWPSRASGGIGGHTGCHGPQPASMFPEKTSGEWCLPHNVPRDYDDPAANKYSDYDDLQPCIPPPQALAPAPYAWKAPGYVGPGQPGWNSPPPVGYPVWTPQYRFGPGPSYATTPVMYPPFYPAPFGLQGPGYIMKNLVPAGGWSGNPVGLSGSLDPAKGKNNNQHDSGNQVDTSGWDNNNGSPQNDSTGWVNDSHNGQPPGDNIDTAWGNQQPYDHNQTGDNTDNTGGNADNTGGNADNTGGNADNTGGNADNTNNDRQQQQQTNKGWGENGQNHDQRMQNNGTWGSNNGQINGQPGGSGWENNENATQPQQPQNGWNGTGSHQPQHQQNEWNGADSQSAVGTAQLGSRTIRPLYGPYGAYYSSRPHTNLSPSAEAEEEPPFDVPETIAAEKGTTHQVQPGKGYLYVHKRASPEYIDSIAEPYARFVFKYRTKEQIKRELGIVIECEPAGDEKRKFMDKTQDELIELLICAQNALGGKIPSPPPGPAGEQGAKRDNTFNIAPVPAPRAYKYLKYELPKGRNAGLGISNNTPRAPPPQQQEEEGRSAAAGSWEAMPASGPPGGWGAPPTQPQPQAQPSAADWQTAPGSGNQKRHQNQGGGGAPGCQNASATAQSSPANDAWGAAPNATSLGGGGIQEAPAGASGW